MSVKSKTVNWSEPFETAMSSSKSINQSIPPDCIDCLQRCFGHKRFREMQWKIISSILDSGRDNCVIMATGYGKSLCFQFPSVYRNTITIVVSPLISLMQDQVLGLCVSNLRACFLGSAQTNRNTENEVIAGKYNIVYVTPEYITGESGPYLLEKIRDRLTLIAIDEAHCISKWGHDFRSAYRKLSQLRSLCPRVPLLAMTATATAQVRDDIVQNLNLNNAQIVSTGFDRPNLEFIVKRKTSIWSDIGPYIRNVSIGSVIVYCISRRVTEEVAAVIGLNGVSNGVYHAGIPLKQRKKTHEDFIHDRIHVVVATIAFGMGINKPDVRLVIHYGVAKDVESYYQEVGRAGRDGLPAKCLLFHNERDWGLHRFIRQRTGVSSTEGQMEKLLQAMIDFVNTKDCRRRYILSYFGEDSSKLPPRSDCCDNCRRILSSKPTNLSDKYHGISERGLLDITDEAFKLLSIVRDMKAKYGLGKAMLILRGSQSKSTPQDLKHHSLFGSLKEKSDKWLHAVSKVLVQMKMIEVVFSSKANTFHHTIRHPRCIATTKACDWLNRVEPIQIVPDEEFIQLLKPKVVGKQKILSTVQPSVMLPSTLSEALASSSIASATEPTFSAALPDIYRPLLKVRAQMASIFDAMPYLVASTKALQQLTKIQPTTMEELRNIHLDGYSDEKTNRFGPGFLKVIREYHAKIGKNKQSTSVGDLVDEVKSEPGLESELLISQPEPIPNHQEPLNIKPEPAFEARTCPNEIIDLISDSDDEDSTLPHDVEAEYSQDSVEVIEPFVELVEIDSDIENAVFADWSSDDACTRPSLSCAEVKQEQVELNDCNNKNKDLDLLIDALKSEELSQKNKKTLPQRFIKKSSSAGFEYKDETDSEKDIFYGNWDLNISDSDLTQVSQETESKYSSESSVPSGNPQVPSVNGENTDLNSLIEAVKLDLSQNSDRKPRILNRKASKVFEYEDDSDSDSENVQKSVISPKKRVLPSWMQLSNKRKR